MRSAPSLAPSWRAGSETQPGRNHRVRSSPLSRRPRMSRPPPARPPLGRRPVSRPQNQGSARRLLSGRLLRPTPPTPDVAPACALITRPPPHAVPVPALTARCPSTDPGPGTAFPAGGTTAQRRQTLLRCRRHYRGPRRAGLPKIVATGKDPRRAPILADDTQAHSPPLLRPAGRPAPVSVRATRGPWRNKTAVSSCNPSRRHLHTRRSRRQSSNHR